MATLLPTWRDAVRDSDVSSTAKAVAWCLSTFMSKAGVAFPGKETIACGCSLSDRAVDRGVKELEEVGLLFVARTKGGNGRPNHYYATGKHVPGWDFSTGNERPLKGERQSVKGERASQESSEGCESARSRGRFAKAATASAKGICSDCGVGEGHGHTEDCSLREALA